MSGTRLLEHGIHITGIKLLDTGSQQARYKPDDMLGSSIMETGKQLSRYQRDGP